MYGKNKVLVLTLALGVVLLGAGSGLGQERSDIFIAGHDALPGCNPCNPILMRADRNGHILWERPIPLRSWGGDHERYADRNLTEDAFYLATKSPEDQVDGKNRILKLDGDGEVLWDLPLSGSKPFLSANPVDGGLYVVEETLGARLFKIDGNGSIVWQFTDPDLNGGCSISTDLTTGGVYVGSCGTRKVLKIDRSGNVVWKVAFPEPPGQVNANPIDGGVYVGYGHYWRFTRRLDGDGNVMWQKDYFPSGWTYGRAVSPLDGALFVGSGWPGRLVCANMDGTIEFNIPRPDYNENVSAAVDEPAVYVGDGAQLGVFKYDAAGNLIWNYQYGPPSWIGYYGIVGVWTGMPAALLEVSIDIEPGSSPNCVHLDGNGLVPVAVLGSASFDVQEIDPLSLSFSGLSVRVKKDGRPQCSYDDVSGDAAPTGSLPDGYLDLVCHFVDDPASWQATGKLAWVSGELDGGLAFHGEDEICYVPRARTLAP